MIIGGLGIGAQEATLRRGSSVIFFFFKQKTAYEILGDWSSDVCSSDLLAALTAHQAIERSGLRGGETFFVPAGAGGVGHLAIQLAVERGARVIASAGPDNQDFLREDRKSVV